MVSVRTASLLILVLSSCSKCEAPVNIIDANCVSDSGFKDGCDCVEGQTKWCGNSTGECRPGFVFCFKGKWPTCLVSQGPTEELCGDGLDSNCNGDPDDITSTECWEGPANAAFGGSSTCQKGYTTCESGVLHCTGQLLPRPESCDTRTDLDCDGIPGNADTVTDSPCGPDTETGECQVGHWVCTSDGESLCAGAVFPDTESCDGLDNDCNGRIDEDLYRPCSTICGSGLEHCYNGSWVGCTARIPTPDVTCDGIDQACTGIPDQGLICLCTLGSVEFCTDNITDRETGLPKPCGIGTHDCTAFGTWGTCYFYHAETETCDNFDNDCDGVVDNINRECNVPVVTTGACHSGTQVCSEGLWRDCQNSVGPSPEICDHIDNDCNGQVDENIRHHDVVNIVFAIDISPSMCQYTTQLGMAISRYAADFIMTPHKFALVTFPTEFNEFPFPYHVVTDFVGVLQFQAALSSVGCDGGGSEPSIDTMYELASTAPGLSWNPQAFPYIVEMTDEEGQTWGSRTYLEVGDKTTHCSVGSCTGTDRYEVFILTQTPFFTEWMPVVFNDPSRFFEINPVSEQRYLQFFNHVFTEVCR